MGIFNPDIKDGYKNNPKLKPVGVTMSYTKEEMAEYIKCMHDPVYFCQTYVKVKTADKGISSFDVYPYQKRLIAALNANRYVISKWPRQSGKTTAVIGYLLHYMIFNQSMTVAMLANKLSTAKELFARFKLGYENLPHFLQQGVLEWNKTTVQLENGSRIFCSATSNTAARGESITCISGDSVVTIKNPETNGVFDIKIEDLYTYSSRKSENSKYLYGNENQQIQELVFFADGKSQTQRPQIGGNWREASYNPDFLGWGRHSGESSLLDYSRASFGSQVASAFCDGEISLQDGVCLFSNDTWETGQTSKFIRTGQSIRYQAVCRNNEKNTNWQKKITRNLCKNQQGTQGQSDEGGTQGTLTTGDEGPGEGPGYASRIWAEFESQINWSAEDQRTYGEDQQESGKNPQDGREASWNETERGSQGQYESSFEGEICPRGWGMEQGTQETPIQGLQVLTRGGFKSFKGLSKTSGQKTQTITLSDGNSIECTGNHLISTVDGFREASTLQIHSEVLTLTGSALVTDITYDAEADVYDLLEVADTRSFYANQIEVHNCAVLDEYAFVPDSVASDFYSSMYPTLSAGTDTKLFIVSTPNGRNHFYKLWTDANRPDGHKLKNQFVPIEVRWQEVPITAGGRLRDEQWKKDQIANTSEDQFEQEYGCSFLGASNTLISSTTLGSLAAEDPITKGADGLHIFEPPKENHTYFLMADVSEGLGRDYSAFSVVDTHTTPYKVVATFRNNVINPVHLPEVIFSTGTAYNNAFVIVETNNIGIQVTNALHNDLEYENMIMTKQGGCKGQQLSAGFGDTQRSALGLRTTASTKRIGCTNLKHLIEEHKLFVSDERIIGELMSFVARNNSYSADLGQNDDLVMTLVFFAWLTRQPYFNELIQEGRQAPDKVHTAEDDSVLFFAKSGEQEDNEPFVQGDCIWYPA